MKESRLGDRPVLVLREPKPLPPERHKCVVWHGDDASKIDNGSIIQCDCGRRYRCRPSRMYQNTYVWVRRLLPWPPKQAWTPE